MTDPLDAGAPGPLAPGQSRDQLVAEVRRVLEGLDDGATVVIALSGGPDSSALAHLAAEARPDLHLVLVHVRHGLRDDEEDVAVVDIHADWLGLELFVEKVEVAAAGHGIEAAARDERYAALRRRAHQLEADAILLAHTADDQAETVLLRAARGTGVSGLAAMAPVDDDLVRPMLRLRRSDIHAFVAGEGLPVAIDPTNQDPAIRRVAVRQLVLPALAEVADDPVGALVRLAELARIDEDKLGADAAQALHTLLHRYGPVQALAEEFAELHPAVATRVIRLVLRDAGGLPHPPSADHVARVMALDSGQSLRLGRMTVSRGGGWLSVVADAPRRIEEARLALPGTTPWGPAAAAVVATLPSARDDVDGQLALPFAAAWRPPRRRATTFAVPPGGEASLGQVVLGGIDAAEQETLRLRSRRSGDRVRTTAGHRKVQDLFVDAKIPRAVRDLVPLVVSDRRLLWIPGVAADAHAQRDGERQPQLHLTIEWA